MFNVRDLVTGQVFTVYAVLGCRFLLWNEEERHWLSEDITKFEPVSDLWTE